MRHRPVTPTLTNPCATMAKRCRITFVACVAGVLIIGHPVSAQQRNGESAGPAPEADSAASARAAYRRAIAAYRQRDIATARTEMRVAAQAWPTQQAYLEAAASLAAAARDTSDAAAWLDRLAALGVGPDLSADTTFGALVGAPVFDSAAARLRRATAPVTTGRVRFTLADTAFHPEGIAFDSRSRRWFLGSVRQRRIVTIGADGSARDFVAPSSDDIAGVFGMTVDTTRRTLWVATTALPRMVPFTPADRGRAGAFAYDIDTGRLRRRVWLPRDSAAHTLGDVAVAPNGDVYASDSQSPWILKVPPHGDTLQRFMTHPLFRSLQGMAIVPDGRTMYVADYSHGILRIDLVARTATALRPGQRVTLLGVDGLYMRDGALLAVQNGVVPARVVRFCLDASRALVERAHVLDRNPALADEPTLAAVVGDSVFYVATSQWEKFDDTGRRRPGSTLKSVTVVGVRIPPAQDCRTQ